MKPTVLLLALAVMAEAPSGAETGCDRYAALDNLPAAFKLIASGHGPGWELVILADGTCVCANTPSTDRILGRPVPDKINWSCRPATVEDRRVD